MNIPKTHRPFPVSDFFPCSGLNMNVSVTLVCNGHYDCDNYEDESSCSEYTSLVLILKFVLTTSPCSDTLYSAAYYHIHDIKYKYMGKLVEIVIRIYPNELPPGEFFIRTCY